MVFFQRDFLLSMRIKSVTLKAKPSLKFGPQSPSVGTLFRECVRNLYLRVQTILTSGYPWGILEEEEGIHAIWFFAFYESCTPVLIHNSLKKDYGID